jgi:alpha,alpha-trehalase
MRYLLIMMLLVGSAYSFGQATPDEIYGELFRDVQMNKVFADGKTFVDCVPKRDPKAILSDYKKLKANPAVKYSLQKFVEDNFIIPAPPQVKNIQQEKDVTSHIKNLWSVLKREPDVKVNGSSLLPLPNPYIVPGGRFGEIYYWDSYFTMLGLKESGETAMIENMVKNFAFLINTYGHIPNGNRSYYLSRSQPPFFPLMVQLLAEIKGNQVYAEFLPAMEKEYQFFMSGSDKVKIGEPVKYVVKLPDGTILNRYWDESTVPRQESWREDFETGEAAVKKMLAVTQFKNAAQQKKAEEAKRIEIYQHLRAGATSGIDFSSRWFTDPNDITTIQTTNMIAVDLNSLLYEEEMIIKLAYTLLPASTPSAKATNSSKAADYNMKAQTRKKAIDKYCWNEKGGFYSDYDFVNNKYSDAITLAGMYPLFAKIPDQQKAERQKQAVIKNLLHDGGFTTTVYSTGQQWDAPNGWAPLQWMTIIGLENYYFTDEARDASQKWVNLNKAVYDRTGRLMEKYNVMDIHLEAGGGEYPSQDGFGWTNGVLLALMAKLK